MADKTIYDLELHETLKDESTIYCVTRVPGGWIYRVSYKDTLIFVPYNNEFQK